MSQWAKISSQIDRWTSPLRPSPEDVAMYQKQLVPGSRVLLLGVTQALQHLATIAVDHDPKVIELLHTSAVLGDWSNLPFEREFDAVIGDGCLTVFQGSRELFFQQVKKVLKPNGKLILRVFISPEIREDLDSVLRDKDGIGFHAFKWKVAHALANPYVKVQDIYRVIRPIWDHPTLDVYRQSNLIYYFPKQSELPSWDHIQFGTSYELAERCPVITWKLDKD